MNKAHGLFLVLFLMIPAAAYSADDNNVRIVRAYTDAYNAQDVDAMLVLVSEDIRWMSVADTKISVEAKRKKSLHLAMTAFFAAKPVAYSELREIQSLGRFVAVVEQAFWEREGEKGSQCALAVYEIEADLILNVWYYSEQECNPAEN